MMSLLRLPYAPRHSSVKSPSFSSVSDSQGTRLGLPSKVLKRPISVKCGCLLSDRQSIRLGLPSKGELNPCTMELLKDCQLSVKQDNPRQYVSQIPQLSNLDVWFQRPKDIVRNLLSGDLDLGIVGLDTVSEYGQGNEDLVIVHEALEYGDCRLSLLVPQYGIFENIKSLEELAKMPQWREENPLRVATGFTYLGNKFMKENGLKHVKFSTADGALEAAPAMGIADAILDLVSSGTTLRENNLKEIEGGVLLESQVTANMRGSSEEEVAERVLSQSLLSGLQGPTISPVFCKRDGKVAADTIQGYTTTESDWRKWSSYITLDLYF